ncbi:MAG: nucleotide disphospho-sugar-binding domain-containing protein, partial [Actinomycetota bacterium]
MKIVCATLPGPGHGHPMLAVAAALARRGHDVTFISGEAHRADPPAVGARFELLPSAGGSPLHALRPYDDAAAQAVALRPLLEEIRPDAALVDVITVGAAVGMELLGIPFATLVVHPLHTPSRALPPFGYGRRAGRDPLMRFRDAWMRTNNRKDLERARADLNRNRAALAIALSESLEVGLSERLVLVATLPSLEIERPDWPPHAHVVGPCLWDVPGAPFEPPPGDGPLVMIAPSTAYDGDRLLAPALGAVAHLGVRAVVTAGAAAIPQEFPANVTTTTARHAAVLPHVAAVVCNGGHGTTVRALSAGVPLVLVPGHGDQQENAFRVERAGAGIQVRRRTPA